jgi:hypothetical protein
MSSFETRYRSLTATTDRRPDQPSAAEIERYVRAAAIACECRGDAHGAWMFAQVMTQLSRYRTGRASRAEETRS